MFDNLDDPKQQMLLAMGLGLLGGKSSNFGNNLSQAGLLGLSTYNQGQQRKAKLEEEAQQKKMRDMQMAQMQRTQEDQAYAAQLAPQFFGAGNAPSDGMGPVAPPKADFAGYGQALMARNPQMGMPFIQAGAKQGPQYKEVGGRLVAIQDGKVSEAYAPPEQKKDWENPAWVETQLRLRKAGAPSVSVDNRQENAFSAEIGKENAKTYGDLMKSGAMAQSKVNKLSRLSSLLDQSGQTGKLTPAASELASVAASIGIKVDPKLNYQQAAMALSNEMALELRNPAGGAGMPGALSDRDREFLVGMVPSLSKTPEGNKMLIETAKKLAQREAQVAKMAREYKAKTGRFDEGFYQMLSEFSAANPLFDDVAKPAPAQGGWSIKKVP